MSRLDSRKRTGSIAEEWFRHAPSGTTEELNLVATARTINAAALRRRESSGGHFQSGYPKPMALRQESHVAW